MTPQHVGPASRATGSLIRLNLHLLEPPSDVPSLQGPSLLPSTPGEADGRAHGVIAKERGVLCVRAAAFMNIVGVSGPM